MPEQTYTRRCCLDVAGRSLVGLAGISTLAGIAVADGYDVRNDIEFRRDPVSLKLDAHIPPGKERRPAVILVHGGGWTGGSKTANFIQPLFPVLDKTGYSWFSIDYRLAPAYPYKAMIDDVEAAIAFVKKNAREYNVDKKRIVLMGESAGAHLVNLVGMRNRKPADVAAVVSFYGPIDIMETLRLQPGGPVSDTIKKVFEIEALDAAGLAKMKEGSPDTYIHKGSAPFLFIHGTKDDPVPYNQSPKGVELMQKAGAQAELITVQDGIHGVINWEKDPKLHGYKAEMIAWLKRRLGS
jgi:acetyl esterase/lipase